MYCHMYLLQDPIPMHSLVGNHDLAVPRQLYLDRIHLPASYFSSSLAEGWRLIALDTTDLCVLCGYGEVRGGA